MGALGRAPSAAIVDYGMGNIRSLARALERAGAKVTVTDDPAVLTRAERIVIPGQGAFGQAMERLEARSMTEPILSAIERNRPVLGVCLGLQILFQRSAEAPGIAGLGVLDTAVDLLPDGPGVKRPHMGWASVAHRGDHPAFSANPSGEAFYFVHSYAAFDASGFCKATCKHGCDFVAAIAKDALVATQFHPEKSQDAGERLLSAWLAL